MNDRQAEKIANVVMGLAAAGGAIYVLRTPSLRRMLWGLTRTTIAGTAPGWLMAETRRAWDQSRQERRQPAI
jgi:hypothetical protein